MSKPSTSGAQSPAYESDVAVARKHGMVPPENYANKLEGLRAAGVALSVPNGGDVVWFLQAEQLTGSVRAWRVDVTLKGLAQFIRGLPGEAKSELMAALSAPSEGERS